MKNFKRIISGVTALALACGLSLNASAELKEGDSKAYRGTGYLAKCEVVSVKDDKSTVKVTLKNTSKKTINHWAVGFDGGFFGKIEDVKYGRLFTPGERYNNVIRDCGTNGSVAPNQCVSFSFTMLDWENRSELPERIRVYSDINKSNTVDELNTAAKICYNFVIIDVMTYGGDQGYTIYDCFENGALANSNSKGGMKTGFNYKYKAYGDYVINMIASQYARGDISVYVDRREFESGFDFFVQVRDNKTGKVGQYPRPTDGTAEWGTFDLDAPLQADFSESQLDIAASEAYGCVVNYICNLVSEGHDYQSVLEKCNFQAISKEGLKIDMKASLSECDKLINDELKYNYEGISVYVSEITYDDGFKFSVQTKDPATGKTGQYSDQESIKCYG
ncbi:hypothetical protein [Ruminococcus albus]|uniref:Cellulose binding domain-containing protein n=1 Tax=Ruminococcus albus TaxID=1264 RepID=A0A1I1PEG2_RUMAL|nr:hypothetical protein [Ruminococcus albus]SFD08187.1 hypothetical protein SAMN02910406_03048 [Ruminococcus albus]